MFASRTERPRGTVVLEAAHRATEILLIDWTFKLRKRALGRLRGSFPAGVYKARYQLGDAVWDDLFEIRANQTEVRNGQRVIARSPSPLPSTGVYEGRGQLQETDPSLRKACWASASTLQPGKGEGVLHLILRPQRSSGEREIRVRRLGDQDAVTARWSGGADPASRAFCLPAGTYVLSVEDGGGRLCRAVPVVAGHQTAVSLQAPASGDGMASALADSSLLLLEHPISGEEEELLLQDAAQQALRRSRALLGPGALAGAGASPLSRLLAAHGTIEVARSRARRPFDAVSLPPREARAVEAAHARLQEGALRETADVAALELLAKRPAAPVNLDVPPLLAATWRTLVARSLELPDSVRGGDQALRMAEHLRTSSLWFLWWERGEGAAAPAPRPGLTSTARHLLEPQLRVEAGRVPAWVSHPPRIADLAAAGSSALARNLQVPIPLILRWARQRDEKRLREARERMEARAKMLASRAPVVLVALPDGVRVDPRRGQALDFDAVFDMVDEALIACGLVAVRAPPVSAGSREMDEALAHSDVLIADTTYADQEPEVKAVVRAWLAHRRSARRTRRLVAIGAEGHPCGAAPAGARHLAYRASFGTGVALADPADLARAVKEARDPRVQRPGRASWVKRLARTERRRLDLRLLRAGLGQVEAPISRLVFGGDLRASLRREPPSVQLDIFLLLRACSDWSGMKRVALAMARSLRRTVLVREQLALALNRLGRPSLAIALLRSVLKEVGPNGETCGLLGRVHKDLWKKHRTASPERARGALEQAIRWYRQGLKASPMDPYPGVNLLTLLAVKRTPAARAERRRRLRQVEKAVLQRLQGRPSYWDLASMVEVAMHQRDGATCEWYCRLALAAPHDEWMRETTWRQLDLLAAELRPARPWRKSVAASFRPRTVAA